MDKWYVYILLAVCLSGNGQARENVQGGSSKSDTAVRKVDTVKNTNIMRWQKKYKVIKHFDINAFERNQKKWIYEFTDNNGMTVQQEKSYDDIDAKTGLYYIDSRSYPYSNYIHVCLYDGMGRIKGYNMTFYSIVVGKVYRYDINGQVVHEEDMDAPYKFSLEDLILKMKKEYGIDIEKGKNIRDINRFTTDRGSFYAISIILDNSKCDIYLFNGDDGKILFKTREESEWYPGMSDENVYDKYLRSSRSGNYGK